MTRSKPSRSTATIRIADDERALPDGDAPHAPGSVRELQARLEAQAALIREQSAALALRTAVFERASLAARIGIWECDLADQSLRWSDMVYDLFDLPRGSALDRERTLLLYPPRSRRTLERVRREAIERRGGFSLDVEIVTAKGRRRWIRITATVECAGGEPARIFGMKQDITEEKAAADRIKRLAEVDAMTGLANRSLFQTTLDGLGSAPGRSLLLIDLDGFKQVNDTFGHAIGDMCLIEAAARLRAACAETDFTARIGGDEFAALTSRRGAAALARRIVEALGRPVERGGRTLKLGASVGVAHGGGCGASELFARADAALYAAKRGGRGAFRVFDPSMPADAARVA